MSKSRQTASMPAFASEIEERPEKPERVLATRGADRNRAGKRKEVMSVRLRPSHAARLRQLAKARRMGHVTLLRRVVEEWIEQAPKPARGRSTG